MQQRAQAGSLPQLYRDFAGQNPKWNEIPASTGDVYEWDETSTYIQEPPFFADFRSQPGDISEIKGARALGIFGDSVTTDHISPAGASRKRRPPEISHRTRRGGEDFNSYGSRRGNDRVMTRGTFANVRIKNLMARRHRRRRHHICQPLRRSDDHLRCGDEICREPERR